jgi:hypothetical protein
LRRASVKSSVSLGRVERDLKSRTISGARYDRPFGVVSVISSSGFAEGAAAAVVDPLVGLGRSEDDADRRRELVVGKGQDVRAWGQALARFPDADLAGRGVLERWSGCGEGRGYLVEVSGQDKYVDVGVRASYSAGEQVECPAAGYPVAGGVVLEERAYGAQCFVLVDRSHGTPPHGVGCGEPGECQSCRGIVRGGTAREWRMGTTSFVL